MLTSFPFTVPTLLALISALVWLLTGAFKPRIVHALEPSSASAFQSLASEQRHPAATPSQGLLTAGDEKSVDIRSVDIEVLKDEIRLNVRLSARARYQLWTTERPAKVILDVAGVGRSLAPLREFNDVVLKNLRIAPGPLGTRIVLDLHYALPASYIQEAEGPPRIIVTVPKLFTERHESEIAPGVVFGSLRRGETFGPVSVQWLSVELDRPGMVVVPAVAGGTGRETVRAIAARYGAFAAINGTYFANTLGRPLGLVMQNGQMVSPPVYDRTALALFPSGEWRMAQVSAKGVAVLPGGTVLQIAGINRPRGIGEIVAYTPAYGQLGVESTAWVVAVQANRVVASGFPPVKMPPDGLVLVGDSMSVLATLVPDTPITITWELSPSAFNRASIAIGGGPRLVAEGKVMVTAHEERFRPDIAVGRAPRTALGVTAQNRLLLVAVNGRQEQLSVGLTLEELARLMLELGAVDAMNLDGGGSTTLVVDGQVRNAPSEGERAVGNAILVFPPLVDGRVAKVPTPKVLDIAWQLGSITGVIMQATGGPVVQASTSSGEDVVAVSGAVNHLGAGPGPAPELEEGSRTGARSEEGPGEARNTS